MRWVFAAKTFPPHTVACGGKFFNLKDGFRMYLKPFSLYVLHFSSKTALPRGLYATKSNKTVDAPDKLQNLNLGALPFFCIFISFTAAASTIGRGFHDWLSKGV